MAYTLGIVFDRILGLFTSTSYSQRLLKWLKLKYPCGHQNSQTDKTPSTVMLTEKHYYIMLKNPEVHKQWEYNDRQVRLLRATSFNSIFIAGIVLLKYSLYWKIWLPLFILGVCTVITWLRARLRSDSALDQLYKFAKPEDKKAEEQ
ncbi:hypothetical protein ES703_36002 [subsurface metagenome]